MYAVHATFTFCSLLGIFHWPLLSPDIKTSIRGQQSRASRNDRQKSFSPQGRAISIDKMLIRYRYNIDTISIQYNTQSTQKYPKISRNTQKYPKIPKSTQKYPKISKSTLKYPKYPEQLKYPKVPWSTLKYPEIPWSTSDYLKKP